MAKKIATSAPVNDGTSFTRNKKFNGLAQMEDTVSHEDGAIATAAATLSAGDVVIQRVGAEFLVNTTTVGGQFQPSVSTLANGNFVVTWLDFSGVGADTSSNGIKAQIFNSSGSKVGSEFLVNTATAGGQIQPSITVLANGDFVVVWTDSSGQGGDTSASAVKAQVFDANGKKRGGEFLVNTLTSSEQRDPTITALGPNGFVVAWTDSGATNGVGNGVQGQIFTVLDTDEDTALPISISAVVTDTDLSETLKVVVSSIPVGATLTDGTHTFTATDLSHTSVDISGWTFGSLTIKPPLNFNGDFQLTVTATATDMARLSNGTVVTSQPKSVSQTFNVIVSPVNDAPVAAVDVLATNQDAPLTISPALLTANDRDVENDPLTVTAVGNAAHGTVSLVDGSVIFTPDANFSGAAQFDYTVSDGHGGNTTATATINVAPAPALPQQQTTPSGTSGDNVLTGAAASDPLTGNSGNGVYTFARGDGQIRIVNGTADSTGPSGELDFGANISADQLWFQRNGDDLSISIRGSQDRITIAGWYDTSAAQLREIKTSDGLEVDSRLSHLVQAMATFAADHPGFDPTTTAQAPDDANLQSAIAAAWHQ